MSEQEELVSNPLGSEDEPSAKSFEIQEETPDLEVEVVDDRQTHVVALVDPAAVHCPRAQHTSNGKLRGRAES